MEEGTESERVRLEGERNTAIEGLRARHALELERLTEDENRRHRDRLQETRDTLTQQHEQVGGGGLLMRFIMLSEKFQGSI